jgi:hypothetical protein
MSPLSSAHGHLMEILAPLTKDILDKIFKITSEIDSLQIQ